MSVNKAILIGRLGQDPELTYTQSGKAVCKFSVATNERWTSQDGQKQESTTWHNIVAWGRQGEVIKEYMSKGREIYIEGRIDNRTYDKKDGTKGYTSEVVVQSFQFIGSRGDYQGGGDMPQSAPSEQGAPSGTSSDDDDLPF